MSAIKEENGLISGRLFIDGDQACAEGAIAAGCRFSAGYPITPSTEIVERLAVRFPLVGGTFIQMEDELSASIATIGAVWGGTKSLCVTSGPGLSLMMENLGYAAMTETPIVFVDVQRGGPSTGLPTLPSQADMMQVRFGSHGDFRLIALCPASPQECFDMTIDAFNLAERYRTPVVLMMDEVVGHMTERVVIPENASIYREPRRWTRRSPEDFRLFATGDDLVPEMAPLSKGYNIHVTGLTHDEHGYPDTTVEGQERNIRRLNAKITQNAEDIIRVEETGIEDADVVVLSYGITSRIVRRAVQMAESQGLKVGTLRLLTAWPFPERRVREIASQVKAIIVPELNLGQMIIEVERAAFGRCEVIGVDHAGGAVHPPERIFAAIESAVRRSK